METTRRVPPWTLLALLGGCGLLTVCLCVALAGGGWLFARNRVVGGPLAPVAAPVNRIAFQGVDSNIYLIAPDGSDRRALTTDGEGGERPNRIYRTPTWSLDSRRLAYVQSARTAGGVESKLQVSDATTGAQETVHTSTGTGPFYLYWAPDNRQLAFLESAGQTIALRLASIGQTQSTELGQGSPFYFAWSPDSRRLLFHVNGVKQTSPQARVSLFEPGQAETPPLSDDPALFLAPDWSPDGKTLLYARKGASGDELVAADASGANPRALLPFRGSVSFAWSPMGDKIAAILTGEPELQGLGQVAFGPLSVMDADGGNRRTLSEEKVLAFFWSPNGQQIAFLTLIPTGPADPLRLRWAVADVATGESRSLADFVPTEAFVNLLPFFDQYARSLTVWSPDSRSIVYSMTENGDQEAVYVVDVAPGSDQRRLTDGSLAVWSWR